MRVVRKQSGISLVEMTVVVAAVAMLAFFAVPAARKFLDSFGSTGSAQAMIEAAVSSARAIAAKEHRYVGIRFQFDNSDPLKANQYMIFIIHDYEATSRASGFRALKGIEPVKLPTTVGVMDLKYKSGLGGDGQINFDEDLLPPIDDDPILTDTTTFSIVFSPSGKLILHKVRAEWVSPDVEMKFVDDGENELGLKQESSRNYFIIYKKKKFKQAYDNGVAVSQYLSGLRPLYINAYTGTIISQE